MGDELDKGVLLEAKKSFKRLILQSKSKSPNEACRVGLGDWKGMENE